MAAWTLVPCLVSLRAEFDQLAPARDKASDGAIGDTSHQAGGSSDHLPDEDFTALQSKDSDRKNEVHAIDVDHNLRKPGWDMQRCLDIIIGRHRDGLDDRLQNVIYNRRIWSRSWGWTPRAYTGASAHTEHAHFSARYTTAQEADTRPWGLLEEDDMTKAEFLALLRDAEVRTALCTAVMSTDGVIKAPAGSKNADGTPNTHWGAGSYLQQTYNATIAARGYAADARALVAQLQQMDPGDVAAAIPAAMAAQVADLLAARLAA